MKACSALVALLALALAAAGYRGDMLWCGARGIPLGTIWRRPGFTADQMPPMNGLTALVTGANSGLGLEVSRQLLRANASVVLACRNIAKCEAAAQTLSAEVAAAAVRPDVRVVHVDLSDLRQAGRAAQTLDAELGALDLLVANAGVAARFPLALTTDGNPNPNPNPTPTPNPNPNPNPNPDPNPNPNPNPNPTPNPNQVSSRRSSPTTSATSPW